MLSVVMLSGVLLSVVILKVMASLWPSVIHHRLERFDKLNRPVAIVIKLFTAVITSISA